MLFDLFRKKMLDLLHSGIQKGNGSVFVLLQCSDREGLETYVILSSELLC